MIPNAHLSNEQLIEHFYCPMDLAAEHLAACEKCQTRFLDIECRRVQLTEQPDLSTEYFQRQRRVIQNRIGDSSTSRLLGSIWVPSGLAVVLAIGIMIGRAYAPTPAQEARPAIEETAEYLEILEPGWFDETYTAMHVAEPRAASPIVKLFVE